MQSLIFTFRPRNGNDSMWSYIVVSVPQSNVPTGSRPLAKTHKLLNNKKHCKQEFPLLLREVRKSLSFDFKGVESPSNQHISYGLQWPQTGAKCTDSSNGDRIYFKRKLVRWLSVNWRT